jgi:hypothetical protein
MRPLAASTMIRPVGVDQPLGRDLAALVGADRRRLGERQRLIDRRAVRVERQRRDAAGVDDALHIGA